MIAQKNLRFIISINLLVFSLFLTSMNGMQPDEAALQSKLQATLNEADWSDQVNSFTTALAKGEESIAHSPSQAIQNSTYSILNTLYQGRVGKSSDDLQTLQFLLQKAPQSAFIPKQYAPIIQGYLNTVNNDITTAQSQENSGNAQPETSVPIEEPIQVQAVQPKRIQPVQIQAVQQPPVQQVPVQQPVESLGQGPQVPSQQIDLEIQQAMKNPTTLQKIDAISGVLNKYFNVVIEPQTQNNFGTALQTLFDQRYAGSTNLTQKAQLKKIKHAKNKTKKQNSAKHLKKSKKKTIKLNSNIKQFKVKHKKQKKQKTV